MPKKEYTSKDIKVLQNVEHIQQIPTMYIADTEEAGAFQLFKELLDNAIDEYLAGHVSKISVEYSDDGVITVQDNGRGIPTEKHPDTGLSTLTTIFTIAGAGGKFKGSSYDGAYNECVGLHGVGVTAVTALSEFLEVWTRSDKKTYYQRFEKGVPTTKVVAVNDKLKGTKISFKLNSAFFSDCVVDRKSIQNRLNDLSYICKGLDISYKDSSSAITYSKITGTYLEDTGKSFLHKPIVIKTSNIYLEMAWADSSESDIKIYVNTSPVFSGTPFIFIKKAITAFFDEKSGKSLKNEVLSGLHIFSYMSVANPKFQGQTKFKLMNTDIKKDIDNALLPELMKFQVSEKDVFLDIVKNAVDKIQFYKELTLRKKTNSTVKKYKEKAILPSKLASVIHCTPEKRELYIVEGESAAGTAKAARDTSYQEVLPLRGKIPNAEGKKFRLSNLLLNAEIESILISIGCEVTAKGVENFKAENSRVGKIILLMDGDPDGQHITALMLAFIRTYLKGLLIERKVYVIDSPLFVGEYKGVRYFGYTKEEILSKHPKATITRLKGHGEANTEELREYATNPKTRKMIQILR